MSNTKFKVGPIGISLPDENQSYFSIFEDLAALFGEDFQSDAVKLLRSNLKKITPKPTIDYESDFTHISTSNVETLIAVLNVVLNLMKNEYHDGEIIDFDNLKVFFENAKKTRPKPKNWNNGDVFSIPLLDNSFAFGQVLNKKYCTCALFNLKSEKKDLDKSRFNKLNPLSILHLSNGDLLNNGKWEILFNEPISQDSAGGSGGKFGTVGSISYGGCGVMNDLANCYWGLQAWNIMFNENYYDDLLLKNILRPGTAKILSPEERTKYRKEKFGID